MTETELREAIIELAKRYGWRVYYIPDSRRATDRGFPDLTLLNREQGRVIFAELKSAKGKLSKDQMMWLAGLQTSGAEVAVWRPEHLEKVIPRALQPRRRPKIEPVPPE